MARLYNELVFERRHEILKRHSLHILLRRDRILHLPVNVQVFVVEQDAAFGGLVVEVGALVSEDGIVFQGGEPVRESGGDVELTKVVGGEQRGDVLPVGGTTLADIDCEVEARAAQHPHELGLRVRRLLEMQPAHHALLRARLVVLHEIVFDSQLFEPLLVITFEKISAVILENRRLDD